MRKILVYSTSECPYCTMVIDYLKSKNIEVKVIDISSDEQGFKEMVRKSGQRGIPVIDLGNKIIVGYEKEEIDLEIRCGLDKEK